MPAGAGIRRAHVVLRRAAGASDLVLDLPPCAEARIEQPLGLEPVERGLVIGEMMRLPADRPVPIEAEPSEVLDDRGGERVARADMPQVRMSCGAVREAGVGVGGAAGAQNEFTRVAMPRKTRTPRHRTVTA